MRARHWASPHNIPYYFIKSPSFYLESLFVTLPTKQNDYLITYYGLLKKY
jgi:hypothetical protein